MRCSTANSTLSSSNISLRTDDHGRRTIKAMSREGGKLWAEHHDVGREGPAW
jgi:hypothetical protein